MVKNNKTQENTEISTWKVLYNDKNNIYIILADYLLNDLLPSKSGLEYDEVKPYFAVRPVVKLPSSLEGTVGETVEIK